MDSSGPYQFAAASPVAEAAARLRLGRQMMCTYQRSHIIVNPAQAKMISEWTGRSLQDLERGNGLIVSPPMPAERRLDVARAAAKVAVAASKRTGRPVDPRVAKLAECPPQP